MQAARRLGARMLLAVLMVGLMSACGTDGGDSVQSGSGSEPDGTSTSTTVDAALDEAEDEVEDGEVEGGFGGFDDDCFVDEDGHGPDCGVEGLGGPADGSDDCFIDEHGHGPDCGMEGLGGPDDLRFLSGWDVDGTDLDVGTVFTLTCEPGGTPGPVWGTGPYSDDSSLCTAAVHAGRITLRDGGTVGGERVESMRTLPGGSANGIDAQPADNWRGAIEIF